MELKDFIKTSATLTTNDKYIINTLSVMAMNVRENVVLAKEIAKVAISNVLKAQSSLKLSFFYVVDSIIKNVGSPYKEIFADKLLQTFTNTFQSIKDQKLRMKLYNLRLTWRDYFSSDLMNDLDEQVKKIDPAWPLVTKFNAKSKGTDIKKPESSDNNSSKSSPDSTTPSVNRDPRVLKLPEIKKELKRKSADVEEKDRDSLFTIDRHGDNNIKKAVNKKGRLEEKPPVCDSVTDGLFGTKDIDLRITDVQVVRDKQWTSEDVFRMLKKKMQSDESVAVTFDKPPPPISLNVAVPVMPSLPAPKEPTWSVKIDGFPQFPNIGTDPRLLTRCPFADPFKTITIDGQKYLLYLDRIQPCIFVNNELHAVRFFCHDVLELHIDNFTFVISPNGLTRIKIKRRWYIACLGGPGHELILNGWPYNVRIDGSIYKITVDGLTVSVQFLIRRPVQVNVQRAIPPYICEWAVRNFFGSPLYLHMPPLNPLQNMKLKDTQSSVFRAELNTVSGESVKVKDRLPTLPTNIDVHDLFQKLVANGIILPDKIVDLNLNITNYNCDLFKSRNVKEINDLQSGHQCDLCGLRFKVKESSEFKLHMDYHFYKSATNVSSTRISREYVGGSRQWILGGSQRVFEVEDVEMTKDQKFMCLAFEDVQLNKCAVCDTGFEMEWNEKEQSHMLLNGVSNNDKVYHLLCFENFDKQIEKSDSIVIDDDKCQMETIKHEVSESPVNVSDSSKADTVDIASAASVSPLSSPLVQAPPPPPPPLSSSTPSSPPLLLSLSSSDHQEFNYQSVNTT